jgi:hypothetical protein
VAVSLRQTSLTKTPWVTGYCPVIKLARAGEHTGHPETAWVKWMLSAAKRSRWGVLT